MASGTNHELRSKIIYEIDVRNYSKEGNFKSVQKDLGRIKQLGVDIIWLMPIYPIGFANRKGSLGSPYAIIDHRSVNPELGTIADLRQLVASIHEHGMKIMLDIVFNHTSLDSRLFQHHPEWFLRDEDGIASRKVADWNDIIDLDYSQPELWEFQIDTLKYWANQGIDGFRCDVAPLVPLEFWLKARAEIQKITDDFIWLAESADPDFILKLRLQGFTIHSDCELYQAFDLTYDYDVFDTFHAYLKGKTGLEDYLQLLRRQETVYPSNYIKMHFLENHDQPRAASILHSGAELLLWTAFTYFQKGSVLLFAGQEALDSKRPDLFEKDVVDWSGLGLEFRAFLQTMAGIKKDPLIIGGYYRIHHPKQPGVIVASYEGNRQIMSGIFNVEGQEGFVELNCPDGEYPNLVNSQNVTIKNGMIKLQPNPVIIKVSM